MPTTNFNEQLTRLEEITKQLESGSCSLEDAVKLFDEGKKIAEDCTKTLENAKRKIEVVE